MFNLHAMNSLRRFNKECFREISIAQRIYYLEGKENKREHMKVRPRSLATPTREHTA